MSSLDRRRVLDTVRSHLVAYFGSEPDEASVTFVGMEELRILRFHAAAGSDVVQYISLGCSADPMGAADSMFLAEAGPRVELAMALRGGVDGVVRSLAVLAAAPAVEGLCLVEGALIDFGAPLWTGAAFTAVVLIPAEMEDCQLGGDGGAVRILRAVPVTPAETAWVRVRGSDELVSAWQEASVDITDPARPAVQPK